MSKTVLFRTRVDARRKKNAERILRRVGLTPGQLVNMVFAQVELRNGVPFSVQASDDGFLQHIPNKETRRAVREKSAKRFRNPEGFLDDLRQ